MKWRNMTIPIWLIILCAPLILIGAVICILFGWGMLETWDELFGTTFTKPKQ